MRTIDSTVAPHRPGSAAARLRRRARLVVQLVMANVLLGLALQARDWVRLLRNRASA
jgi:hypothetical protein